MSHALVGNRRPPSRSLFAQLPLVRSSATLIITQALTALLGYGYWLLVAHRWPPEEVGTANSAMAAALLCALVAGQGLVPAVLLALPRSSETLRTTTAAAATLGAAGLSIVVSSLTVAVVPGMLPALRVLWAPDVACWFVLAVAVQAAGTVVDAAAIALRERCVVIARNVAVSVAKIAILATLATTDVSAVTALMASLAVPGCVSVLVGLYAATRHCERGSWRTLVPVIHTLGVGVTWHYISSLSAACPQYLLALIVTARLGSIENAHFSIAWLLSTAVFMISPAVSQVLLAEGARADTTAERQAVQAAKVTTAVLPLPMIVLVASGGLLLSLFGPGYAAAWPTLVILAIGSMPDSVANILCALLRIRGGLRAGALVNLLITLIAAVGAWSVTPAAGIAAVATAWMAAQAIGSLVALVLCRK